MPKCIDVKLAKIVCDRNGFGGPIQLTGNISAQPFRTTPTAPTIRHRGKGFSRFRNGRIKISTVQPVEIEMENSVTFCLSTPTTEPAGLNPRLLKIGGDLTD